MWFCNPNPSGMFCKSYAVELPLDVAYVSEVDQIKTPRKIPVEFCSVLHTQHLFLHSCDQAPCNYFDDFCLNCIPSPDSQINGFISRIISFIHPLTKLVCKIRSTNPSVSLQSYIRGGNEISFLSTVHRAINLKSSIRNPHRCMLSIFGIIKNVRPVELSLDLNLYTRFTLCVYVCVCIKFRD